MDDLSGETSTPARPFGWRSLFVCITILGAAGYLAFRGRSYVRKLLIAMVAPTALFGLGICLVLVLVLLRRRRVATALLACAAGGYMVLGNDVVASRLMATLEDEYYQVDPYQLQPMDVVIVLGGGTGSRRNGVAVIGCSGDRVMLAARLYHLGKASRLITTGSADPSVRKTANAADETARIFRDLGIPAGHIEVVHGTRTSEEIPNLKRHLANAGDQRIGLITSAWHLPRAMRLAKRHDLEVIPVPADFWTDSKPGPLLYRFLPTVNAFDKTHRATVEYLAMMLGR